jgi:hypothetical protein
MPSEQDEPDGAWLWILGGLLGTLWHGRNVILVGHMEGRFTSTDLFVSATVMRGDVI